MKLRRLSLSEIKRPNLRTLALGSFGGAFLTLPLGTSPNLILSGIGTLLSFMRPNKSMLSNILKESWILPCVCAILLNWIGLLYTPDPKGFGIEYASKTYYWIFPFALLAISISSKEALYLVHIFLLGLLFNSLLAVLQFIGVLNPKNGVYSGLVSGYNSLSLYLTIGILTSSYYFKISNQNNIFGSRKIFYLINIVFYFFHLAILQGRTGYFVFLITLPILIKNFAIKGISLRNYLILLLLCTIFFSSPIVQKRVTETIEDLRYHISVGESKAWGREYTTHQDRFYMWYGAVELFLDHPLYGLGTGGYALSLKKIRPPQDPLISHPHNNLLHILTSFGLIGFGIYFWLFYKLIQQSYRMRFDPGGAFIFYCIICFLLGGIFNTTLLDSGSLMFLMLGLGLLGSTRQTLNTPTRFS